MTATFGDTLYNIEYIKKKVWQTKQVMRVDITPKCAPPHTYSIHIMANSHRQLLVSYKAENIINIKFHNIPTLHNINMIYSHSHRSGPMFFEVHYMRGWRVYAC